MSISSTSHSALVEASEKPVDLGAPIALYVHIPFCLSKCNYCDFNTYEGIEDLMPSFVDALSTEIALWGTRLNRPRVATVFFGGGTPSYLPGESITRLLDCIDRSMQIVSDAEITLEANPDDVDRDKSEVWLKSGFNRISIGIQSFVDPILVALSRRHGSDEAAAAVEAARDAGFANISIDLMFGLPKQSLAVWENTLRRAIELGTEHLSLYGLQVELGTPLYRDVQRGDVRTPGDDLTADMYELAVDLLGDAGYEHYEISNWAKPGYRSQHNLAYWLNKPYLGVGPGAHSSMFGKRFANMKSPRRYIETMGEASCDDDAGAFHIVEGEFAIDFVEVTSQSMAMSETMMLGMRLSEGVSHKEFRNRFGTPLRFNYGTEIDDLTKAGLIEHSDGSIRLTRRGRLLGNNVFERFILDSDEG
ncbi:MAG: radical SAM family heme chaperone HemW [Chloroflexi bacterium]|nr:radical SAM family heme chaperone HemW [Chloroflexota bacterium]